MVSKLEKVDSMDLAKRLGSPEPIPMDVYMLGQGPDHMLSGSVTKYKDAEGTASALAILRSDDPSEDRDIGGAVPIRTEREAANVITFLRMAFRLGEGTE